MNRLKQVLVTGIGVGCLAIAAVAPAQIDQGLFEETLLPDGATFVRDEFATVERERYVKLASDQLRETVEALPHGETAREVDSQQLRLNFFDDVDYSVSFNRKETRDKNDYTLFGTINDTLFGHCTVVVQKGKVTGNCSSALGMYQIRYISEDVHQLTEVDQSRFPPEAEPILVPGNIADADLQPKPVPAPDPLGESGTSSADTLPDLDDGSIIDILVVYTPAAASASANIMGEIQLAISETNQAYVNSGVSHRVRLVAARQITYTESGNFCGGSPSDLARLKGTTDGFMDIVHTWRNTYNADQVSLIVNSGNACGCAYYMDPVSSSFASSAFSVTLRSCATGYFSFGHELGHNMSATHDCAVSPGLTPYAYGHGLVNLPGKWRTVMAYNNACSSVGGCTRVQYFSNPAVSYNGASTGSTGAGCQANNMLVHQNSDLTVSRFRDGTCELRGIVERVLAYDDSVSSDIYVYIKPSATASYHQYFRTTDDNMASSAASAAEKKVEVYVRGDQSCLPGVTGFGGNLDYIKFND